MRLIDFADAIMQGSRELDVVPPGEFLLQLHRMNKDLLRNMNAADNCMGAATFLIM